MCWVLRRQQTAAWVADPVRATCDPPSVGQAHRLRGGELPYWLIAKKRQTFPKGGQLWKPLVDELVRTPPAPEVAKQTGRTFTAAYSRRTALGMPDGRRKQIEDRC